MRVGNQFTIFQKHLKQNQRKHIFNLCVQQFMTKIQQLQPLLSNIPKLGGLLLRGRMTCRVAYSLSFEHRMNVISFHAFEELKIDCFAY